MKKVKKYIINKKIIEKLMFLLIIIQPLLDFSFLFEEKFANMLGFSIPTIVRLFLVGLIGILFLIVLKNKKEKWLYFTYISLILFYTVFHHLNAINFTNYYGGYDFGYNLIGEIFYIIRMLIPLALIIISSHYKFEDDKIEKMIWILIILLCGSIILTNLFKISIGSYSHTKIEGNIMCWFTKDRCNLNYYSLASKAFFNDPNRLAALLTLITPLVFYNFIKKPKIRNYFLVLITLLGMYMLGTKVSTYGFLILSVLSFIVYIFFTKIKKEEKYKHSIGLYMLVIILISIVILPYTPAVNRTFTEEKRINDYNTNVDNKLSENNNYMENLNNLIRDKYNEMNSDNNIDTDKNIEELLNEMEKINKEEKDEPLIEFIENNYINYSINPKFILDSYPYKLDPTFWYNVMKLPLSERTNFRLLEELMLKRIKEINNNKLDDYLGITFTREGNIFDLERDFVSHYYTLGILGLILLLMPYIIIVLICGIKILTNIKNLLNLKNVFYLMGIGIALFAAFYSGNVMDGLIVTIILGFIMGQLINSTFNIENAIKEV